MIGCPSLPAIKALLENIDRAVDAIEVLKSFGGDSSPWKPSVNPFLDKIEFYIDAGKQTLVLAEKYCEVNSLICSFNFLYNVFTDPDQSQLISPFKPNLNII